MVGKTFSVGVVGHRDLGSLEQQTYSHFCCYRLLSELKRKYSCVVAVSALAAGADSLLAQSALSLDITLESIIPFEKFSSDFIEELDYERYMTLRSYSYSVKQVNFVERSHSAYKRSMEWLVFKSHIVVAMWNGRKEGDLGGTWQAVLLSQKMRKTLVHIDSQAKTITCYCYKEHTYQKFEKLSISQAMKHL